MQEIPDTPYSYSKSLTPRLEEISTRVKALRQTGSLSPEGLQHLRQFFRIKSIYNSNAIEGNTLDVGETRLVVEKGLTITGKPLKDQAEANNLAQAVDFLEKLAADAEQPVTEMDIRQIHQLVLQGIDNENAGNYRKVSVKISGSDFPPPGPESVPMDMKTFSEWLARSAQFSEANLQNGILTAAAAHTWMVMIHPFIDGNGRVARLLMNLVLMRHSIPIAIISKQDRMRYYDALEESQAGDLSSFVELVVECLYESLEEYEKAAKAQTFDWINNIAENVNEKQRKRLEEGRVRHENEYVVWQGSMDLLRGYFQQAGEAFNERVPGMRIIVKSFEPIDVDKYMSLCNGDSVKRSWFFRLDFRLGDRIVRYLFFFGFASPYMKDLGATLHLSREDPPGSFYYERLDNLTAPNIPSVVEIGYEPKQEAFVSRDVLGERRSDRVEHLCRRFFEDVIRLHFQSA